MEAEILYVNVKLHIYYKIREKFGVLVAFSYTTQTSVWSSFLL